MKEVLIFLNKQIKKDKIEYRGHIPTKYNSGVEWSDFSWTVGEILMFLNKNYFSSYTLRYFGDKYEYGILDDYLKSNFKTAYEKAEELKDYY